MEALIERLRQERVIVADGAMGTMLQEAGLPAGMAPEVWLLEHPGAVREIHRAYLDAGAEMILSATFGGTRVRLAAKDAADRLVEANRRAVEIAREAAGDGAYVVGDIGPLGAFLAPVGDMTPAEATDVFAEQAAVLAEAGVDAIYIETMSDLSEMRAAIEGAQRVTDDLPILSTFSFDRGGRTNMGVTPEQASTLFLEAGVTAFGANCGDTLEMTAGAIKRMHTAAPDAILIAKPNAGKPRREGQDVFYDAQPADMAEYARRFVAMGARIVGGCCGSTPAHIRAIAEAVT
jgi:5-methyltetrahydrofolate--homocysteine methyltransferase